jgi:hypothetical protein
MVIELDVFIQYSPQQVPVIGLFLDGMGKEEIRFIRDKGLNRYFFDPQEYITTRHLLNHRDASFTVLLI